MINKHIEIQSSHYQFKVDKKTQVYDQIQLNRKVTPKLFKRNENLNSDWIISNTCFNFKTDSYRNLLTSSHYDLMNTVERRVHDFLKNGKPFHFNLRITFKF